MRQVGSPGPEAQLFWAQICRLQELFWGKLLTNFRAGLFAARAGRRLSMNILVCGAGVIGTLYAARLRQAGHRVTVLARGQRLEEICRDGLVIEDITSGTRSITPVETSAHLHPDDCYELALVTVRKDQLASIIPDLAGNYRIPAVLFMLNNPLGFASIAQTLGPDRVLLGFPGAGGTKKGIPSAMRSFANSRQRLGNSAEVHPSACARSPEPSGEQVSRL
jgi:ketopantoate reductase